MKQALQETETKRRQQLLEKQTDNKTMFKCNYFWKAVYIHNDGQVRPCCYFEIPSTSKKSNNSLHNDENLTNVRKQVLNNIIPNGCNSCVKYEEHGIQSHRQDGLTDTDKFKSVETREPLIAEVSSKHITSVDLRLGNTCNYMCVMCNPENSHLIAKEDKFKTPVIEWGKEKTNQIINWLTTVVNIRTLTIGGGEPFYNRILLTKILKAVLPYKEQLKITIITNGSTVHKDIFKLLNQFNKVNINLSLDGTNQYVEMLRWKSNWKQLEKNVTIIRQLLINKRSDKWGPFTRIRVVPVITALTITNLSTLLQWIEDTPAITDCHLTLLLNPDFLQCSLVKQETINKVLSDIQVMNLTKTSKKQICTYLKNIKQTPKFRSQFDSYFADLKKLRGLDVYKAIPELKDTLLS